MATLTKDDAVKVEMEVSMADSKGALAVLADNKSPEDQAKVLQLMALINMDDTTSVISFGVSAQAGLSEQSSAMLAGVRNKDTGPAGQVMNGLMVQIRGLGLDDLDPNAKRGFIAKLLKKLTPLQKFIQQYESIESQIDATVAKLEGEQKKLNRDVLMLDGMYNEALKFFNELAFYIEAAEMKLEDVRAVDIPALQAHADKTDNMMDHQKAKDMVDRSMDLERKIHDLMLTRTVTMQMLPQLRMIQDTDKSLVTKIGSSILVTIPVWKNQIAMSIALHNQAGAAAVTKAVGDATSEMIETTAKQLRTGNAAARKEVERGVIDIESIKRANEDLIATIAESIQIAEEGQRARIAAKADMNQCETELKAALRDAKGTVVDAVADSI